MILGVQIINFDIFDNDQAGILIDESISPVAEGAQRANPMRKLNALIGRNNTGKTSFMGCLAYMKDCVTDGVTAASISCGRPGFSNMTPDKSKPSKFKVFFKLGDRETGKADYIQYELSILANRFGTPVVSYEKAVRSTRAVSGRSGGGGSLRGPAHAASPRAERRNMVRMSRTVASHVPFPSRPPDATSGSDR